jgi:hypothetical protein
VNGNKDFWASVSDMMSSRNHASRASGKLEQGLAALAALAVALAIFVELSFHFDSRAR